MGLIGTSLLVEFMKSSYQIFIHNFFFIDFLILLPIFDNWIFAAIYNQKFLYQIIDGLKSWWIFARGSIGIKNLLFVTTFFLFLEKFPFYIFIQYYFFTNFQENLPPQLLFGILVLLLLKKIWLLNFYSGLLLYSELYKFWFKKYTNSIVSFEK